MGLRFGLASHNVHAGSCVSGGLVHCDYVMGITEKSRLWEKLCVIRDAVSHVSTQLDYPGILGVFGWENAGYSQHDTTLIGGKPARGSRMPRRFLTRDEARAFYDRFGSKQDWQRWYEGAAIRKLRKHGGFDETNAVLELGCGTGAFAEELLEHDLPTTARYLGMDSSSTMVELTRKRLARFTSRAEVVLTDGSLTFTLPDASFDRVVSNYVLDLLSPEDIRQVLTEVYRLLKPDGCLCVVSLTHGSTWVSRMVTWLWNIVHWLSPRLVGGCRPVSLQDFLDEEQWRIDYHNVVTAFGIPSEVVVASKCGGER